MVFVHHCPACDRSLAEGEHSTCAPTRQLALLRGVERRPAMYWGETRNLFDSLVAFIAGHTVAVAEAPAAREALVPPGFHEFVWKRVGAGPMNGHGWTSAIRLAARTDEEAFRLFFKLREDYEIERETADQTTADPPESEPRDD